MYHMYIRHKQFAKKITLHFGLIADILFDILSYLFFLISIKKYVVIGTFPIIEILFNCIELFR